MTKLNKEFTRSLIDIAYEAGKAIMEIYSKEDFGITEKENHSPLTLADTAANTIIVKELAKLTPDIPVLSEESKEVPYEERKNWQRFWLVDPLDGTKEFIKRNGEFTVNIALVEGNRPIFGVVYAPAIDSMYYGIVGTGAYKITGGKETVIKVAQYHKGDTMNIAASKSHRGEETDRFIENLEKDNIKTDAVSVGSSLKFCLVAEGAAHIYPRFGPTMEWDTGAAQAVVEAAGGSVTNLKGQPLLYNKQNLLSPYFIVNSTPNFTWQKYIYNIS